MADPTLIRFGFAAGVGFILGALLMKGPSRLSNRRVEAKCLDEKVELEERAFNRGQHLVDVNNVNVRLYKFARKRLSGEDRRELQRLRKKLNAEINQRWPKGTPDPRM